ncbi:MAG: NUDIX hydrolase [SAR324 cluster bacterium]|nr:NUDIX hydrolase [SAR324 cluster bacterium]
MQKKKPYYLYEQSAVIPFIRDKNKIKIMLITSRKRKNWVIPKGGVVKSLSPADSAAKEALEEAGIEGTVFPFQIGEYQHSKWNGICRIKVFLLEIENILQDWEEAAFRKRKLVSIKETKRLVNNPELTHLINKASSLLIHTPVQDSESLDPDITHEPSTKQRKQKYREKLKQMEKRAMVAEKKAIAYKSLLKQYQLDLKQLSSECFL